MRKLAQQLGTLALISLVTACTHDDDVPPGSAGGGGSGGEGGSGGAAVECVDGDTFDAASCPDSYPDDGCIVYVDGATETAGDGSSWETPLSSVQAGIDLAHCATLNAGSCAEWQVWVREGSYYIHQGCREHTVWLRPNVAVYGGFGGDEAELEARDWAGRETILDGRDGPEGSSHVYHVMRGANDAVLDGLTITGGRADHDQTGLHQHGGGLHNLLASPTVANCTFRDNRAVGLGGAVDNYKGSAPQLTNCHFVDNRAEQHGGAVANVEGSDATFTDCTFVGNTAVKDGGAVKSHESSPVFEGCTFQGNASSYGGALNCSDCGGSITDSSFADNETVPTPEHDFTNGGAVSLGNGTTVTLTGVTFTGNVSAGAGGAVMVGDNADVSFIDCLFTDNTSTDDGGAMLVWNAVATVSSTTFSGNESLLKHGGAVSAGVGTVAISDSLFDGNRADGTGGGLDVCCSGSVQVSGTTFTQNEANQAGGAVSLYDGANELTRCVLRDNAATWGGGMVMGEGASAVVTSSAFSGNMASWGGAIEAESSGALSLVSTTVAGNTAVEASGGGAIFRAVDLTLDSSILWANTPDELSESGTQALSVSHSAITGGHSGTGNIGEDAQAHDPGFVDLQNGDLHLSAGSPCIDAGDEATAPATDLDGNPRVDDPNTPNGPACGTSCVDMGAYEYQPPS